MLEKLELIVSANQELEQQLAEKDEIIDWQNEIVEGVKQEEELLAQKLKSLGVDCIENLGKYHDQDKISFAVSYLEVLKAFIIDKEFYYLGEDYSTVYVEDIIEEIDNQIKQLKEMK